MADRPLRPATHRRLGGPLPHQLANGPRAPPRVIACKHWPSLVPGPEGPETLSGISPPFGGLFRARGQVTHVLLTRSPLYRGYCYPFLVRLACVRHAASVRSEPGSNSPIKISRSSRSERFLDCLTVLQGLRITWDVRTSYLVFKERGCLRGEAMLTKLPWTVNTYFEGFSSLDF